jgi:hypothetical protein
VAVTTFLGDVLEHLFVEQQLRDEALEPFDLGFQLPDAPGVIGLGRVEALPPAVVGVGADAVLAADIGDRQALGQVPVGIPQETLNLSGILALAHESLLGLEGLP